MESDSLLSQLAQSLTIAGLFLLTPLQNTLSIYSTALSPSMSSFPVYAPTSHPLPVISPASTQAPGKGTLSILNNIKLPLSFQKESDKTLLLIRENRCGIDGLRNGAVPGFSNIWLEDNGPWGLRGVHPVSFNDVCRSSWTHDLPLGRRLVSCPCVSILHSSILVACHILPFIL